jgi:hypothetical protein
MGDDLLVSGGTSGMGLGPGFDSNHLKVGTHPGAVDNKNAYVTQVFGLFHKH